ncbi:hypothetical protein ABZY09_35615 [Streptomyces sp. NPDC002928]|uniref:hypothetical protein n=1 Tax=Streptomyces sp. NPDC002928 TaxID=3154440 RepID=UPI0033A74B94
MAVTNAFAAVPLLPMSDRDKDAEILVLRHQVMAIEMQLGAERVEFDSEDRAPGLRLHQRAPHGHRRRLCNHCRS